jgi:prepilin-type N-terminal cleavage/methylation domain-containing protein
MRNPGTRRQTRTARRAGFTLLEVLAALSLFAIVAAGTGAMALQSMRHTVANRHATQAAMLAQEELEYQRGLDFDAIVPRSLSRTMGGQYYTVTTGVVANTPAAAMSTITVTVGWTGPEGSKSYAVQTIYTTVEG